MVRQFIPVFVALIAAVCIESSAIPVRRRRQVPAASSAVSSVPCPVQCTWSFSQAWAKAISFETPTANMIDDQSMIASNASTFDVMCSLYLNNRICLRGCAATNKEFAKAFDAAPTHSEICADKKTDFDSYFPCVSNNTKTFQRVCQKENENLLAASVRLTTSGKPDPTLARQFCSTANHQSFCILPVLRQTCGDGPYNSMRTIMNATFASVRATISDDAIEAFYPECSIFFETIEHGIPSSSDNKTIVDPFLPINGTAVRFDNSTSLFNATPTIMRDDPNGPTDQPKPKPRITSTTSSNAGTVIQFHNVFVIFAFFLFSYNVIHL